MSFRRRHAVMLALVLVLGCVGGVQNAYAQNPGAVVLNSSKTSTTATSGVITLSQKIGPYAKPVHVFLTALGTATGTGARASVRTQLLFSGVVHASNSDEYENPDSTILESTANFDFVLSSGQNVIAVAKATGRPSTMNTLKLRFFYKAIGVTCSAPTVC